MILYYFTDVLGKGRETIGAWLRKLRIHHPSSPRLRRDRHDKSLRDIESRRIHLLHVLVVSGPSFPLAAWGAASSLLTIVFSD